MDSFEGRSKKGSRPPDDSSFCSQQCERAYANGLRRLTLGTEAKIEHGIEIPRSRHETLVEIDCMAYNVGGLLLSGTAAYFPPQSRVLNREFIDKQVTYLHLCVEVKYSWKRVTQEIWHGDSGKTARLSQAFREGKLKVKERDTLFVILFNGTEPQDDIMASRVYSSLATQYLMVWYNQEDLLMWSLQLQIAPLQEKIQELEAREVERQRATSCPPVWVQILLPGEDPTRASHGIAFQVFPTINNVDSLKDAVKAKNPSLRDTDAYTYQVYVHVPAEDVLKKAVRAEMQLSVPAPVLQVYVHVPAEDGGVWKLVERMSAELMVMTNEVTAYHVVVPVSERGGVTLEK